MLSDEQVPSQAGTNSQPKSGGLPVPRPMRSEGRLSLVATPIGNLEDITLRALRCLKEADLIIAEDTRHTRKLLTHYNLHKPLASYYKDVERQKTAELLELIVAGKHIALVTDAGTPGIADPGVYIIKEARQQGLKVEIIPGPSALLTALLGSGMDPAQFCFFGFLAAKPGPRRRELEKIKDQPNTLVFFVSPHKLAEVLQDMLEVWGERQAVLCREMTKIHEEFLSGSLSELAAQAKIQNRGEYTLVVEGVLTEHKKPENQESIPAALNRLQKEGLTLNQAVAQVARHQGIPRARIYALAHAWNKQENC